MAWAFEKDSNHRIRSSHKMSVQEHVSSDSENLAQQAGNEEERREMKRCRVLRVNFAKSKRPTIHAKVRSERRICGSLTPLCDARVSHVPAKLPLLRERARSLRLLGAFSPSHAHRCRVRLRLPNYFGRCL